MIYVAVSYYNYSAGESTTDIGIITTDRAKAEAFLARENELGKCEWHLIFVDDGEEWPPL